jgi:signal transduction histidine kinase
MNAEVRRQSFLIFKEAINNVARHSGCKSAEAMLKVERGIIILELRDDGRGFDDTNGDEGHGLGSMRQRAEKLGGKLEVVSKPGEGTTITLKAPVGRHA